jgi:DNA-binding CsgD family transcriptional regulator
MTIKKQQDALFDNLKPLTRVYPSLEARLSKAADEGHPYVLRALEIFGLAKGRSQEQALARYREEYGLTDAEAKLAQFLVEGGTLTSYALTTSLSRNTVRSYLKSIFSKTGANRQAELILILGGERSRAR